MNIQDEVQKIHNQYGTSEMANYQIQKLFDKELKEQLTIHLQVLSAEIKEKAEVQDCNDGKGCGMAYCEILCQEVSKSSIETITNNYIKNNVR